MTEFDLIVAALPRTYEAIAEARQAAAENKQTTQNKPLLDKLREAVCEDE